MPPPPTMAKLADTPAMARVNKSSWIFERRLNFFDQTNSFGDPRGGAK